MPRIAAKSIQTQPKKRDPYTPAAKRARVVALHVAGKSNRAIASEEGIDRGTIARILTRQQTVNLLAAYQSRILTQMVPKALAAVEEALDSRDLRLKAAIGSKLIDKLGGFEEVIGLANAVSPEAQREDQRLLFLGRLMEMTLAKSKRFNFPLPPDLEAVDREMRKRTEDLERLSLPLPRKRAL